MQMKTRIQKHFIKFILRHLFRALFGFLSLAFLFAMVALIFFSTSPGERWLKNRITDLLNQQSNLQFQCRHFTFDRLSVVTVRHFNCVYSVDEVNSLIMSGNRFSLQIFPPHFLFDPFHIQKIMLDSFQVEIVMETPVAKDSTRPKIPSMNSEIDLPKLSVDQLILNQGRIIYRDSNIPLTLALESLTFEAFETGRSFVFSADPVSFDQIGKKIRLTSFGFNGGFSPTEFRIDSLNASLPDLKLTASGRYSLPDTNNPITGECFIKGNLSAISELIPQNWMGADSLNGYIHAEAAFRGELETLSVKSTLSIDSLRGLGLPLLSACLHANWTDHTMTADSLQITLLGGQISGNGFWNQKTDSMSAGLSLQTLQIPELWEQIFQQRSPFNGSIQGTLSVQSEGPSWIDSQGSLNIRTEQLTYLGSTVDTLSAEVTLKSGRLIFDMHHAKSNLISEVTLHDSTLSGTVDFQSQNIFRLARFANFPELSGTLSARSRLGGTLQNPDLAVTISGADIRYKNFPVDRLYGQVGYTDRQVTVDSLILTGTHHKEDSTAHILDFPQFTGGLKYRCSLSGKPARLSGSLNVELEEPGWDVYKANSARLDLRLDEGQFFVDRIWAKRKSLSILGEGFFKPDSQIVLLNLTAFQSQHEEIAEPRSIGNIALQCAKQESGWTGDAHLRDIEIEPFATEAAMDPPLRGTLEARIDLFSDSTLSIDSQIRDLTFAEARADSVIANIRVSLSTVSIDRLVLFSSGQSAGFQGSLGLSRDDRGRPHLHPGSPIEITGLGQDLDLIWLSPLLPEEMRLAGGLDYELEVSGTPANPHLTGRMLLSQGRWDQGTGRILDSLNTYILFDSNRIHIPELKGFLLNQAFQMKGTAAMVDKTITIELISKIRDESDLTLVGTFSSEMINGRLDLAHLDMQLFNSLIPSESKLAGRLNAHVDYKGSPKQPELRGSLTIRDARIDADFGVEPLTKGILDARFEGETLTLDSLRFETAKGHIRLDGDATLHENQVLIGRFNGQIHHLRAQKSKQWNLWIRESHLSLQGLQSGNKLSGEIMLGESRYTENIDLKKVLLNRTESRRFSESRTQTEQTSETVLDLRIHNSPNLWVDNNLAKVRAHPELSIQGTLSHPVLSGRVSLPEGSVSYLDRKFEIKQGVFDFVDPYRFNPIIDLKAESTLKAYQTLSGTPYTVTLALTGPLDQMRTDLTSEPQLSRADIISLLTLGSTRSAQAGTSPNASDVSMAEVLQERAAQLSSRRISSYASQKIGTWFGMDDVSIEGNLFKFGKSWGPQLVTSKKITPKMDLTYTTTIGHANEQSIRLDYKLGKNISLEGQTDQKGQSGLDLKYKLKFK